MVSPGAAETSGGATPKSAATEGSVAEAAFTPGPWRVTAEDGADRHVTAADATLDDPWSDPWNIAVVVGACGYPDDPRTGHTEANARLIAAAPDLLSACKNALIDLEYALAYASPGSMRYGDLETSIEVAREAIGKALGEQG